MCGDPRLHAGHVPEESVSPMPNSVLDVLQKGAIFHLHILYAIEPADPKYTSVARIINVISVVSVSILYCLYSGRSDIDFSYN